MKATRSYTARPELKATEHRLDVVVDGQVYSVAHVITHVQYAGLDPDAARKLIETQLWGQMMHTLEHYLRKNLTHA